MKPRDATYICRRCGRKLRTPESQILGMGPTCYVKWKEENQKKKLFQISSLQSKTGSV